MADAYDRSHRLTVNRAVAALLILPVACSPSDHKSARSPDAGTPPSLPSIPASNPPPPDVPFAPRAALRIGSPVLGGKAPLTVTADASSSPCPAGCTEFEWSFGDGQSS